VTDLTDAQRAQYFRRCYTAADGLWFMMTEEKWGFEAALERDAAVWKVLPKIQARTIRKMMGLGKGLDALRAAIDARLSMEGYHFKWRADDQGFVLFISKCPWQEIMERSSRGHISQKVSSVICGIENSIWASEFEEEGQKIGFQCQEGICQGEERCVLRFCRRSDPEDA